MFRNLGDFSLTKIPCQRDFKRVCTQFVNKASRGAASTDAAAAATHEAAAAQQAAEISAALDAQITAGCRSAAKAAAAQAAQVAQMPGHPTSRLVLPSDQETAQADRIPVPGQESPQADEGCLLVE